MGSKRLATELIISIPEERLDCLLSDKLDLFHIEKHLLRAKLLKEAIDKLDPLDIGRYRSWHSQSCLILARREGLTLKICDIVVDTSSGGTSRVFCHFAEQVPNALFLEFPL